MIKKLLALTIIISSITIIIGCKSNINNDLESESSKALEFIKEVVDNKINKEKMGNSVHNILNEGLVAYDEENVYYNEMNILNGKKYLYKKNIKTNETNEINEMENKAATYINIYDDYIYYVSSKGGMIPVDEIIRVKKDGSEKKVIVSKEENVAHTSVQIIGDFLYYAVNIDGDNDTATKMDLMKIDLKTLEEHKIITLNKGEIISINNKGIIETYLREFISGEGFRVVKKIEIKEGEDFTCDVIDISDEDITSIIGSDANYIYYFKGNQVEKRSLENYNEKIDLLYIDKSLHKESYMIGKDNIYYASNGGNLTKVDINTKESNTIKEINIRHSAAQWDKFALKIFEVKGDLAYYNYNKKLIIDKDINVFNSENKTYNNINFNIFNPNRKLTEDEAIRLAYYRVGRELIDDGNITEFDGRECLDIKYVFKENEFGHIYVDLNSGEVYLNSELVWEKYEGERENISVGGSFQWKRVNP